MISIPIVAIVTEHNRKKKLIETVQEIADNDRILSDIIKDYPSFNEKSRLTFGVLRISLGIGLLISVLISYNLGWVPYVWLAYLIGALIFGGLALVVVHFLKKN